MSEAPAIQSQEIEPDLDIWRSKHALSDQPERRLSQLLVEAIDDLDALHRDVPDAQPSIEEQIERGSHRVHTLRAALSALKRIPPEILTEIFWECGGHNGEVSLPPAYSLPLWRLGHVCAHWRQILWDSPYIWNNLDVQPYSVDSYLWTPKRKENFNIHIRESFNYILSRASAPVSLKADRKGSALILDIIISHNHRFRSIYLGGITMKEFTLFTSNPPESFQNLVSLTLFLDDDRMWDTSDTTDTAISINIQMAPNLQKIFWDKNWMSPISLLLSMPWTQLTDLSFSCTRIPASSVHKILQSCSSLASCHADLIPDAVERNKQPVILLLLKLINLDATGTLDWDNFLHHFSFPALTSLYIYSTPFVGPIEPFKALISRSGCVLKEVTLKSCGHTFDREATISLDLFQMLPTVETLNVDYHIPTTIIRSIFGGLCPLICNGHLIVDPEGFAGLLDWADSCILREYFPAEGNKSFGFLVDLLDGPGQEEVERRYDAKWEVYQNWMRLFTKYKGNGEGAQPE